MMLMTAMTFVVNKGLANNMKTEALEMAEAYEGNVQIQIDVKKKDGIAIMRITEYNV